MISTNYWETEKKYQINKSNEKLNIEKFINKICNLSIREIEEQKKILMNEFKKVNKYN